MKNFSRILARIAYVLLFLFPFVLGTFYAIKYITGGWEDIYAYHGLQHYLLPELNNYGIAIIIILLLGLVIFWASKKLSRGAFKIILITLFTVVTREVLLVGFNGEIEPFSDGLYAWQRVHGDMSTLLYVSFFPGWANYTLFLQMIVNMLGDNYMLVLHSNVLFNAITAVMIYLICNEIGLKESTRTVATFLYVFNPAAIIYVTFDTPEHMAIAFNAVACFFIVKSFKSDIYRNKIVFSVLAGLLLGLGSAVKTFGVIFVLAYIIALLLYIIGNKFNSVGEAIKNICVGIFCVLLMFFMNSAVESGITTLTENQYEIELNTADSTPHYFLVGLNYQGEGQQFIGETGKVYINLRQQGVGLDEGKAVAYEILKQSWEGHENFYDEMSWLNRKMIWAWQDDMRPLTFFTDYTGIDVNSNIEDALYSFLKNIAPAELQLWYLLLMLLSSIGVIYVLVSNRNKNIPNQVMYIDNYMLLMLGTTILGYFCMLIISEAQSRYKCLIIPVIGIFAALGIEGTVSFIKMIIDKRTSHDKLRRI